MTREMMRKYAEDQLRLRPTVEASGKVFSSVDGVLGVLGVRREALVGPRLPYGESRGAFSYPAVLICRNPIEAKRVSALETEASRGSADSASDMEEEESLSDILGGDE
jgi:hypothetical protein